MGKTIAITVIVLVAVVMGMNTFAPAAMAAPNANARADIQLCHWGTGPDGEKNTGDEAWEVIFVPTKGSMKGHVDRHTDGTDFDKEITGAFTVADCLNRNL